MTTKRKKAVQSKTDKISNTRQKALVDSFRGSMSDLKLGVDEYLREKYAETDAENDGFGY